MESRNTEIILFIPSILHHYAHKKFSNELVHVTVRDSCNLHLAHTEINTIHIDL